MKVVKHVLKAVCGAGAQLGELARAAAGAHGKHLLLLADKVFGNMCEADPAYSTTDLERHDGGFVSCVLERQGHKRLVIMVCSSKRGVYPCIRKIAATLLTVGGYKNKKCNSTLFIELDDVVTGSARRRPEIPRAATCVPATCVYCCAPASAS